LRRNSGSDQSRPAIATAAATVSEPSIQGSGIRSQENSAPPAKPRISAAAVRAALPAFMPLSGRRSRVSRSVNSVPRGTESSRDRLAARRPTEAGSLPAIPKNGFATRKRRSRMRQRPSPDYWIMPMAFKAAVALSWFFLT
jgi:hypothetical protein